MERPPTQSPVLKFGVFEVDLASGELRKAGLRLNLSGQPFEVLRILLQTPHELVTREELRRHLWPDNTFVDYDLALKRVINRLREALGDSADNPRFIETIPRKGYRFIAPVSTHDPERLEARLPIQEAVAAEVPTRRTRELWIALGLGAAFTLLAIGFAVSRFWPGSKPSSVSQIHSLAVLPLQNLSADPAQEYFSDGMTDALITDLAQIGSLKVISRTSSMQYKQTKKSLPEIAHELNVDGIIEGSVQRSGEHVRITAQLIQGATDKHIWAKSYEEDLRDVFTLEREVATDIAQQVQATITAKQPVSPRLRRVDPKVWDAYVEGNYYLSGAGRGAGDEERKKARKFFQQAIDLDSNFAPAYIGLAESHQLLEQGAPEDLAIVKRAAEKALELDPTSSEARMELAGIKWGLWDWSGAEADYWGVLALNPNDADAHDSLANDLDVMGRLDEGWKEHQIAQELDPNHDHLADALYQRGQLDQAIEIRKRIAKRDPADGYNHYALALAYAQKGLYKQYVEEMSAMAPLFGQPEIGVHIEEASARTGYRGALRQWATELEYLAAHKQAYYPGALAQAYAALGEKDRAFYWLEQYSQHRDLASAEPTVYFKTDPWFRPLRSDPRFNDYLRRVNLQP